MNPWLRLLLLCVAGLAGAFAANFVATLYEWGGLSMFWRHSAWPSAGGALGMLIAAMLGPAASAGTSIYAEPAHVVADNIHGMSFGLLYMLSIAFAFTERQQAAHIVGVYMAISAAMGIANYRHVEAIKQAIKSSSGGADGWGSPRR